MMRGWLGMKGLEWCHNLPIAEKPVAPAMGGELREGAKKKQQTCAAEMIRSPRSPPALAVAQAPDKAASVIDRALADFDLPGIFLGDE